MRVVNIFIIIKKKVCKTGVLSVSLRKKLIDIADENFGPVDIQKMLHSISPNYCWPTMKQVIIQNIKHCCDICQKNKEPKQKRFVLLQAIQAWIMLLNVFLLILWVNLNTIFLPRNIYI